MTFTPTTSWQRAMKRAIREGLKATRRVDGTYRVASISAPTTSHTVLVDDAGRIIHCSDCKGWENGGRLRPCKHAGAVAVALTFLGGHSIAIERTDPPMESYSTKRQLFRSEA